LIFAVLWRKPLYRESAVRLPLILAPSRATSGTRGREMSAMPIKRLALILGAMIFSSSAFPAGIDSRTYTCAALHNLIAAQGFVFINNPTFEDFVVANASSCSGGGSAQIQLRSVPTIDNPECLVNYCITHDMSPMSGGM